MKMTTISILTTSRNRPELLKRLYKNIQNQVNEIGYSVQWLIGVDGDEKNTFAETQRFIKENDVDWLAIESFSFEGIGKHKVLNRLQYRQTGWVTLIIDDDDFLVLDAFQTIVNDWQAHPDLDEITYLRGNKSEDMMPIKVFPYDFFTGNVFNYRYGNNLIGDYFETFKTTVFNGFEFPEFLDEKFIPEGSKWQQMAVESEGAFKNQVIYLSEYLPDGLTKNIRKLQVKNPKGFSFRQKQVFEEAKYPWRSRVRALVLYAIFMSYVTDERERVLLEVRWQRNIAAFLQMLLLPYAIWLRKKVDK